MKILLINKFYYYRGGAETVFFITKKILEEAGHHVVVFSMDDSRNQSSPYSEFFVSNIDFAGRDNFFAEMKKIARSFYSLEAKHKLEQLIKQEKPDIAHIHNFMHQLTPSILKVLRDNKIPVVQTLHDYQLICPNYHLYIENSVCERCKQIKFFNATLHRCLKDSYLISFWASLEFYLMRVLKLYREKIDYFISPSDFLSQKIQSWFQDKKIPIIVVPNPFEVEKYEPNYNLGDYVLCVSRFIKEKGIETLIRAMKNNPSIKLKIAGSGPDFVRMKDIVLSENLSNVELLGHQAQEQVLSLVKNCRFVVIPSELYENQPMVILESMALGKPVLGSDIGGIPELISKNKTGWLFEAGNVSDLEKELSEIYSADTEIVEFGKAARKYIEQTHSSEVYYHDLIQVYDKLLGDRGAQLG
ncbi:hypothetical protein A2223_03395 [Candidatus Falkowbacteria bacterium RIFOXYA2_FULL_35_8]|uniref:Group 1 glycosyl transferase n=1 Tax=Candidatus Falkowbacteria bacterium RIFOXYC2_FULL_36_12 TaxID=1798002 RepID=A0A1F5SZX3_9BACT|nr:MAG: hypothetical protein A2300_01950 [Candidatus Falkowbacteria bacterium RIFOXYB2_FULL_35_7]OGF31771.1 MAG: hypothetical protein A2478_04775 [Candidatus Falkowbacteria bacterium RIFOXYC2_FULL_36_12]OGF33101.1 MAG: hypothetical protein A2223_03395 [Candidatus Falkowbacteria bacterium RIFOXYA2_FULL_35_8]